MFPEGDWNGPVDAGRATTTVDGAGAFTVTVTVGVALGVDADTGAVVGASGDVIGANVAGPSGVAWTAVEPVPEQPVSITAASATTDSAPGSAMARVARDRVFMPCRPPFSSSTFGCCDGKRAGVLLEESWRPVKGDNDVRPRRRHPGPLLEEAQSKPPKVPPLPEAFAHARSDLGATVDESMGIAPLTDNVVFVEN